MPEFNPESYKFFQVDLRCYDLSQLDLSDSLDDLWHALFDDRTVWPDSAFIPKEFNRRKVMELGKNPGLGIRQLHKEGITGRGVGIAIIDQVLLVDHQEYVKQLRLYEEINVEKTELASMHGAGVASIAVGKTVGVAPETDLYYIGLWHSDLIEGKSDRSKEPNDYIENFGYYAQAIRRILKINEQLPKDRKIRVISISKGFDPSTKGYKELTETVEKAKAVGMLVICPSWYLATSPLVDEDKVNSFRFLGLGRAPLANPDDFSSFRPTTWQIEWYEEHDHLLVPMDSRTTASPTGTKECVFYGQGGTSWVVPYIAGVYALAAQIEPDITPDRFWALAIKTGEMIEYESEGKNTSLGPILNPSKLMEAIKAGDLLDQEESLAKQGKHSPVIGQNSFDR